MSPMQMRQHQTAFAVIALFMVFAFGAMMLTVVV